MIKEIKKGQRFYCYKTFDDGNQVVYREGNYYLSEKDACVTGEDEINMGYEWYSDYYNFMRSFNENFDNEFNDWMEEVILYSRYTLNKEIDIEDMAWLEMHIANYTFKDAADSFFNP